jgi:rhamnose transport system ATP-binding protein
LGEKWPRKAWGGTDWKALNAEAKRRLDACELNLDPGALCHTLSPAQRQEVAIARSLAHDAKLLILDEPTASLTEPEVERLFAHLSRLRERGVALLYVSHRLDEILKLTSRVIVLRDGQLVAEQQTSEATIPRLVQAMVGRELAVNVRKENQSRELIGSPLFQIERLTREPLFRDISLSVHAGEIVGLAGLVGAGRSELARALYGLYAAESGSMKMNGKEYLPKHPSEARERGIVYIPEERKRQGLVLDHSTASAVSAGFLKSIAAFGIVPPATERRRVREAVTHFGVKPADPERTVGTLSGGNQQKALLARWLETDPKFVILDEPTRGVDVGAKAEIHRLIRELAEQGKGILLISSDLPEVLALSDRIMVLHAGRIAAEFGAEEATQEAILLAASGFA